MIKKLRQFATNLLIMSKEVFEKVYAAANENRIFEAVYNEYGKLDEMHPKLKALIAAGLIGTAGLGMQSCNMAPEDDTYYEMPSGETPGEETPTDEEADKEVDKGEETQLSEFEQACEAIGIPHELGNKLKDEIGKWARPKDHYNKLKGKYEHKIYENGKGFVPYDENSYQGECRIVWADGVFYCVPKNTETYRTDAYEVLWPNSAE